MTGKRRSFANKAEPHQPRAGRIEAAMHLRLTAYRYATDNANEQDVRDAFAMWEAELKPKATMGTTLSRGIECLAPTDPKCECAACGEADALDAAGLIP